MWPKPGLQRGFAEIAETLREDAAITADQHRVRQHAAIVAERQRGIAARTRLRGIVDEDRITDRMLLEESARRFGVDMAQWPLISAIDVACAKLPALARAAPLQQPDAA